MQLLRKLISTGDKCPLSKILQSRKACDEKNGSYYKSGNLGEYSY